MHYVDRSLGLALLMNPATKFQLPSTYLRDGLLPRPKFYTPGEHRQVPVHAACTKTKSHLLLKPETTKRNHQSETTETVACNDQNEITKTNVTAETTNTNSVDQE